MVLEIKYVNANNAVIHTENLVTVILAKISLGTGIWYPLHDPLIRLLTLHTKFYMCKCGFIFYKKFNFRKIIKD